MTSYMVDDADAVRADDPSTFVPLVSDALGTAPLNAADIMLMPEPQAAAFTVISSIDLTDRQRIDAQTVFGGAQDVYLTRDSLFLTSPSHVTSPITDFPDTRTPFTSVAATTDLTRIALDDGQLTAAAQARIPAPS
ncbi:hypothetical protein G7085_01535 [Tessaracoccus sp. HDW20]|nr:hypothetical protein [Tessaracoccus coleopterorum]